MTVRRTNDERLRLLTRLKEEGVLFFVTSFSENGTTVRFHVKPTATANTQEFTGTQVDAFLLGVRVGQREVSSDA